MDDVHAARGRPDRPVLTLELDALPPQQGRQDLHVLLRAATRVVEGEAVGLLDHRVVRGTHPEGEPGAPHRLDHRPRLAGPAAADGRGRSAGPRSPARCSTWPGRRWPWPRAGHRAGRWRTRGSGSRRPRPVAPARRSCRASRRRPSTRSSPAFDRCGHPRSPLGHVGRRRQLLARYWTCSSVKPARPHGPFSTPIPLHLKPPKGWCGPRATWALTQAVPHSRRSATAPARSTSARPHRAGQAEGGGVGPVDDVVDVAVRDDRQGRAELLLVDDPGAVGDAGEDGRLEEVAGPVDRRPAGRRPWPPPARASATSSLTRSYCGWFWIGPSSVLGVHAVADLGRRRPGRRGRRPRRRGATRARRPA